jgi:hypothetical protein
MALQQSIWGKIAEKIHIWRIKKWQKNRQKTKQQLLIQNIEKENRTTENAQKQQLITILTSAANILEITNGQGKILEGADYQKMRIEEIEEIANDLIKYAEETM